jgi:subtilisin
MGSQHVQSLALNRTIDLIEPDVQVKALCFFGRRKAQGPEQRLSWGIEFIEADRAWKLNRGQGSRVAVIDTGLDTTHADLADAIVGGINTINSDASFNDDNGHGTHVAGIIAARDNDYGVVGVAPEAELLAVKALDRRGEGNLSDVIEGLQWSVEQQVDVVNMSLGTPQSTASFRKAVEASWEAGVLVIAAAGNSGPTDDSVLYPARYDQALAVGALGQDNKVPSFSSRGPQVNIVAPGVDIYSTWRPDTYQENSGTSMAAPFVAGTAALILSAGGSLAPSKLRSRLNEAAIPLPDIPPAQQGAGVINARKALSG